MISNFKTERYLMNQMITILLTFCYARFTLKYFYQVAQLKNGMQENCKGKIKYKIKSCITVQLS